MKILQTMAGGVHGGAETFFEDLAAGFGRAGLSQKVAIRSAPLRVQALRGLGIETRTFPFGSVVDFYTPWQVQRIANSFRPDVVLGWMNRACRILPRGSFVCIGRLGGYYDLKYYQRCDALICNTRDIVDYVVREGWPRERAVYIPNFCPELPDAPIARTSFDTPDGAPIILALARLEAVKGLDVAIRALRHLPGAVLWVAGVGSQLADLQQLARHEGVDCRVKFLGWRMDRGALLKTADVCWVPSRHEPFGNVVINAWVHRIPVVATASEGPRVLIDSGSDGIVVPLDDHAALATATHGVLSDRNLKAQLVAGGHAKAAAEFSERAVVDQYINMFNDMLQKRK
jgi:glycosyltransferase involved in cell wall biosynthesis